VSINWQEKKTGPAVTFINDNCQMIYWWL